MTAAAMLYALETETKPASDILWVIYVIGGLLLVIVEIVAVRKGEDAMILEIAETMRNGGGMAVPEDDPIFEIEDGEIAETIRNGGQMDDRRFDIFVCDICKKAEQGDWYTIDQLQEAVDEHIERHKAEDNRGDILAMPLDAPPRTYFKFWEGYMLHISRLDPEPEKPEPEADAPKENSQPFRSIGIVENSDWTGFDDVECPEHYARGTLECIDWIRYELTREEYRGYLKGNIMKYLWRHEEKGNPIQDLEKLRKYASFLIIDYEREKADENMGFEEPTKTYIEIEEDQGDGARQ